MEEKKLKTIEHEKLVKQYLKRVNEKDAKEEDGEEDIDVFKEKILSSDNEKNNLIYENKGGKRNLEELTVEAAKILAVEKENKNAGNEELNNVFEETLEETEILSNVAELDASDVKEELISEEIIRIEPERDHSYALITSCEIEEQEAADWKEQSVKEKSPSPIIDVVDISDEKDLIAKRIDLPKAIFPMRSIDGENSIVWNVLREGIDSEDLKYLQTAFESLHVFGSDVVRDHHWSYHPGILFRSIYHGISLHFYCCCCFMLYFLGIMHRLV